MQKKRESRAVFLFCLLGIALGVFSAPVSAAGTEENKVRISGRVTDFSNRPIPNAKVELMNSQFEAVATAISVSDGSYALTAPKGNYMALIAVKNYQIQSLEYWAWNVPASEDLEINPRFDRIEVYAINAWRPQGAYPSYQIYFRPMSLKKTVKKITEAGGIPNFKKLPLMDIAPELGPGDIAVTIDGQAVDVLRVNKILEAAGPGQDMVGYVIQTGLPKETTDKEYSVITITLSDQTTGEKGEGSLFIRVNLHFETKCRSPGGTHEASQALGIERGTRRFARSLARRPVFPGRSAAALSHGGFPGRDVAGDGIRGRL